VPVSRRHRGRLFTRCRGYGDSRAPGRCGRRPTSKSPDGSWLMPHRASPTCLSAALVRGGGGGSLGRSRIPFWINARTDVVPSRHPRIDDALERSALYAVGSCADSLFLPGLSTRGDRRLAAGPLCRSRVMVLGQAALGGRTAAAGRGPHQPWLRHRPAAYAVAVLSCHRALTRELRPVAAASPTTHERRPSQPLQVSLARSSDSSASTYHSLRFAFYR